MTFGYAQDNNTRIYNTVVREIETEKIFFAGYNKWL